MSISILYPLVSSKEMNWMQSEFQKSSKAMCFAFVVDKQDEWEAYMDIYIWEGLGYQRYVITPQFYWTKQEEESFRAYQMSPETPVDGGNMWRFLRNVERTFPEISFCWDLPFFDLLVRFYYVLHWCYPQEKFYKAGFDRIAKNLHYSIKDVNDGGETLEKILGLPVKILRMLNTSDAINHLLATEKRRRQVKELFEKYNFLYLYQDRLLSGAQVLYLADLIDNKYFGQKGEEEEIFRYLESIQFHCNEQYQSYMKYLAVRKRASRYVKLPLYYTYDPEDQRVGAKELSFLEYYDPQTKYEEQFEICLEEEKAKGSYEYENEQYCIRLPLNLEDFLGAGKSLQNCLWTYVHRVLDKRTHIVFLCDRNRKDYVVGALEISNKGKISCHSAN